jgi:hypothetical protein
MADVSALAPAVPVVLFLGMYAGIRLKRAGYNRARRDYPVLADRAGLVFRAPVDRTGVGQLRGTFRGRQVIVDPDETTRISVEFATPCPIECRSYDVPRRPAAGLEQAHTGVDAFDRLFKYRYAAPALLERLMASRAELRAGLAPFRRRRASHLRDFVVKPEGIDCYFDFGKPPHIPASVVEEVLEESAALADLIEAASDPVPTSI